MSSRDQIRIERIAAVIARTGLSKTVLYEAISRQEFPAPIKLSARAVGFVSHEVDLWLADRIAERGPATGRAVRGEGDQ